MMNERWREFETERRPVAVAILRREFKLGLDYDLLAIRYGQVLDELEQTQGQPHRRVEPVRN